MEPVLATVPDLAEQGHKSPDKFYEWARRKNDPLPIYYPEGERYGFLFVDEFKEWVRRNSKLYGER